LITNKRTIRIKQLLLTPLPKGVLKYSFIINKTEISILHNRAYKISGINLIQPFKSFYTLYGYSFWFLFLGWKLTWKTWRSRSVALYKSKQIPPLKQLGDLLRLTIIYTSPPIYYYRLKLYNYKSADWHKFIFTNELPAWHKMMSPNITKQTKALLTNKSFFAAHIQKVGVPVISDLTIQQGKKITHNQLFLKSSIFIKPVEGNRQIDNYPLYYETETSSYKLVIEKDRFLVDEIEIITFINTLLEQKAYLFQPLLQNHPDVQKLTEVTDLITIRYITICKDGVFKGISAVLEIPLKTNTKNYCILTIDIKSGKVLEIDESEFESDLFKAINLSLLKNYNLPFWKEINDCAIKAHQQVPDLFSVGWDLAITTDGIKLIEGNINWDVTPHQTNGPDLIRYFV
jgi:hypothetical protein